MPELPEVETTCRGLAPYLEGRRVEQVRVHDGRLRWPVPEDLGQRMTGSRLLRLQRRAKYLLFHFDLGVLIGHLGMSGSFRLVPQSEARMTHDHVVIRFEGAPELRLNDPRRFGSLHWTAAEDYEDHFLIQHLGPEPLGEAFSGGYLHRAARGRRAPIKAFLMDARVVVGVGNIYANEALFRAGIHPLRAAGRIGRGRFDRLAENVREVLAAAVAMGGTTLRDFVGGDGKPGYFKQSLDVYGRGGEACRRCGAALREVRLSQRTTVYCPSCQR
ncbi:MAG: bifunctional DNA-formamidopyrimidine glycosylase/DNA-(apurinic or apyrimidinic site) lyase [Pseudomonadota bacterium]|nr:bifunctional DNA-formamidopyrimidine glycosylase/DNA-(apurinic or apyrimidinic site) lyase [Pseudomonadota bacterium]